MSDVAIRLAVEALPVHTIGGYEWECYECHYHFANHPCHIAEHGTPAHDQEVSSDGQPSQHDRLVDLDQVLAIVQASHE